MNILVINRNAFGQDDVIEILKHLGHKVFVYDHKDITEHRNAEIEKEILDLVTKEDISLIFSYNYVPVVSIAIKDTKVKYISYVYDSPNIALYTYSIIYPCNYVFIFDYAVYEELRKGGIKTVYYLPLSVHSDRLEKTLSKKPAPKISTDYKHEISFIGSLYNEKHNFYERIMDALGKNNDYLKGYLDSIVTAQSKVYGSFFIPQLLTKDVMDVLLDVFPYPQRADSLATPEYVYAHYFLARKVAETERTTLLSAVSEKYDLSLFTHSATPHMPKVHNMGKVDYYDEMPFVFRDSKINLNISLKSILTGIPLRCIDIMGCGGFLLTNYQADMFRHFEPGVHFDYFTDEKDLLCKIDYYLSHEEERMAIAENARETIKLNHNLTKYLQEMIEFVFES